MDRSQLVVAVTKVPAGARWSAWFILAGLLVITVYLIAGLGLAGVAGSYFAVPKTERDAAVAGSALLAQLQYLQSTGTWLEPFKFVGLSLIITGIFLTLGAIVQTLRVRGAVMQAALTTMKGVQR